MAILLDNTSSDYGSFGSTSFQHTCSGTDRVLIVSISISPDQNQEVTSVLYDGINLSKIDHARISKSADIEVWYLLNPSSGDNTVEVNLNGVVSSIIDCASYTGIKQTSPIFNQRTGAGKDVVEIPVKSFMKVSGLTIGCGVVNNEEGHIDELIGSQTEVWDTIGSGTGLRSQAIAAIGEWDLDEVSVNNKLTVASDWAISIIGFEAS